MALYINGEKVKLHLGNIAYYLNLFSEPHVTNGVRLLTSDGFILKDFNGLYFTTKEDE